MTFCNNSLLEWKENGALRFERILHVEPDGKHLVCVKIGEKPHDPNISWPFIRTKESLDIGLAEQNLKIQEKDPFLRPLIDSRKLSEAEHARWEKNWKAIQAIVEDPELRIFRGRKKSRGLIKQAAKSCSLSRRHIYWLLKRFWQGGQTRQCVLPDYSNCGGRERRFKGGKKRGKRSALEKTTGHKIGICITDDVKTKLVKGRDEFYYHHSQMSLEDSYNETMAANFDIGSEPRDGVKVPVVKDDDEIPTLSQYKKVHYDTRNPEQERRSRMSDKDFDLKGRALNNKTESVVFGPGLVGQMDSTTADIYLVSEHDPDIIVGRPIIYAIKDAWCKFLYSIIVTFERPSYWGAALALENALIDKVGYCADYGVTITQSDWPVDFLPATLRVDGGEMSTYKSDHLILGLPFKVVVLPSGRGDLKGIIERHFELINRQFIRCLKGSWPRFRPDRNERRELDGQYTISQFRRLLIQATVNYHKTVMNNYKPSVDIVEAGIPLKPIELLHWGLLHRGTNMRRLPIGEARYHLLPHAKATVKETGVEFNGLSYTSERVVIEKWQVKARANGTWELEIAFDPRYVHTIYYKDISGCGVEPLTLINSDSAYGDWTWEEIMEAKDIRQVKKLENRHAEMQNKIALTATARQLAERTEELKAAANKPKQSNAAKLQNIAENRSAEKINERYRLAPSATTLPADPIPNVTPVDAIKLAPTMAKVSTTTLVSAPKESKLLKAIREHGRQAMESK